MDNYTSVEEFIKINYYFDIEKVVKEYLQRKEGYLKEEVYDDFVINDILIDKIDFIKSEVSFLIFNVYYTIFFDLKLNDNIKNMKHKSLVTMKGTFRDGFHITHDEIDADCEGLITRRLVPIMKSNYLEKYAQQFLNYFCPEALIKPTKIDIPKMFSEKGIDFYYGPLENNVLGKTYFASCEITVFDEHNNEKKIHISPGTILINNNIKTTRSDGALRNILIHEAVHWFFHRNYFEMKFALNHNNKSTICYDVITSSNANDIFWMEMQARRLAPRILMPKKMALQKYSEIYENVSKNTNLPRINVFEKVLKEFSEFFDVSILSSKIRLEEIGIYQMAGICNYIDGEYKKSYLFKENILHKHQTFNISFNDFYKLLLTDNILFNLLNDDRVLFINNMLVVNNSKYIDYSNFSMTQYALENVDECCFIFDIKHKNNYKTYNCELNYLFYEETNKTDERNINQEHTSKIFKHIINGANDFDQNKINLPCLFSDTLKYHYENAKEKRIVSSYDDLGNESDVSGKTIKSYIDGKTQPTRINIIKIAIALKLYPSYTIDLLRKADLMMTNNTGDNAILFAIIYGFPRVSLDRIYRELLKMKKEYLLELSKAYLDKHMLT